MRLTRNLLALAGLLAAATASAQVTPPQPDTQPVSAPASQPPALTPDKTTAPGIPPAKLPEPYGAGLRVNLSADGGKYLRLLTWHQVWTRYTENNTGTLRAPNKPQISQVDFGLRRSRLIILAQLNPRFMIYTHLGINNQNAVSGGVAATTDGKKPQFFIHEAVTEYLVNKYLSIGAGLHYQNGLSRMTNASTLTFLAMDAPLTNWPTIEQTDQFARWLGVYAKGRIGRFDYRVSMNDAFLTNQTSTPLALGTTATTGSVTTNTGTGVAAYNPQNTDHVYQGYFSYNFFDLEANQLPFMVGSYLGTKKVLVLGGGFLYNKDAMYSRPTSDVLTVTPAISSAPFTVATQKHDMKLFAGDIFYDMPLNKESGTALTAYGVYYNYDFGPSYVRYVGALNPGYGASALRGNAVPQSGTGQSVYLQAGFLTPKKLLGSKMRLQPYGAYLHSSYDGLKTSAGERKGLNVYDIGANFLLDNHNAKITFNYRARPDFTNVNDVDYKPEVTVQTMIYL